MTMKNKFGNPSPQHNTDAQTAVFTPGPNRWPDRSVRPDVARDYTRQAATFSLTMFVDDGIVVLRRCSGRP